MEKNLDDKDNFLTIEMQPRHIKIDQNFKKMQIVKRERCENKSEGVGIQ